MQPVKTIKAGTYNTNPQRDAARLNIPVDLCRRWHKRNKMSKTAFGQALPTVQALGLVM